MTFLTDERFVHDVREVKRTAYGVAYLILRSSADAEDAMSAAILSAYEHRGTLRRRDSFRAWFLRILRNEAYAIYRKRRHEIVPEDFPDAPTPAADLARNIDVQNAVFRLPEQQRNALLLQQEGYSIEEIATVMEIPVGTVKSRLARARDALRKSLEEL